MTDGLSPRGVRLFAITDRTNFPDCFEQAAELCQTAHPGTVAVVLRERAASGSMLYQWARLLRAVTSRYQQELFVADRADLAILVGADGVHLPSFGLTPASLAQTQVKWVSRSGHGLEAMSEKDFECTKSFWVSPVAAQRKGQAPLGEAGLRERVRWIQRRAPHAAIYALGGIDASQVLSCERAGAKGVAAIGAVWMPGARRDLLQALDILRESNEPAPTADAY